MPSEEEYCNTGRAGSTVASGGQDCDADRTASSVLPGDEKATPGPAAPSTPSNAQGDSAVDLAALPQSGDGHTIVREGRYLNVTITSGPLQGDSFRIDTEGPRGIAAARERMRVPAVERYPNDSPEPEAEEKELPAQSSHDGSGRQVMEEDGREVVRDEGRKAA